MLDLERDMRSNLLNEHSEVDTLVGKYTSEMDAMKEALKQMDIERDQVLKI